MTRRNGLIYRPFIDHDQYEPAGVLVVDGIRYRVGNQAIRPIMQLIPDDPSPFGGTAHMDHRTPPTDAELDAWVGGKNDHLHLR